MVLDHYDSFFNDPLFLYLNRIKHRICCRLGAARPGNVPLKSHGAGVYAMKRATS
jgi:hypothetical protein